MKKDKDYAYLIGFMYRKGVEQGPLIPYFVEMCVARKRLVSVYKTLMRIKEKHIQTRHIRIPFNDYYIKAIGYLQKFRERGIISKYKEKIEISDFEYCLAMVDEDFLNKKINVVSEELAFLNANIKVLLPYFRRYKKDRGISGKYDISKMTFNNPKNKSFSLPESIQETFNLPVNTEYTVKEFIDIIVKSSSNKQGLIFVAYKEETYYAVLKYDKSILSIISNSLKENILYSSIIKEVKFNSLGNSTHYKIILKEE